jgi:hypothetical protein
MFRNGQIFRDNFRMAELLYRLRPGRWCRWGARDRRAVKIYGITRPGPNRGSNRGAYA